MVQSQHGFDIDVIDGGGDKRRQARFRRQQIKRLRQVAGIERHRAVRLLVVAVFPERALHPSHHHHLHRRAGQPVLVRDHLQRQRCRFVLRGRAQRQQRVVERMVVVQARGQAVHPLHQHERFDRMQAAARRAGLFQDVGVRADVAQFLGAERALQQARRHRQRQAGAGVVVAARVAAQQYLVEEAGGRRQRHRRADAGHLLHRRRRIAVALEQFLETGRLHAGIAAHVLPARERVRQRRQRPPVLGTQGVVACAQGVLRGGLLLLPALVLGQQQTVREQPVHDCRAMAFGDLIARGPHRRTDIGQCRQVGCIDLDLAVQVRRQRQPAGAGRQGAGAGKQGGPVDVQFFAGFEVQHGAAA